MTDEALKRAFRQLTGDVDHIDAGALASFAAGHVKDDQRAAHLKALAESAQNADLLKVVRALQADADELSADVQRARHPVVAAKRVSAPLRWLAIAASIALAGVVGLVLRSPVNSIESPTGQGAVTQTGTAVADGAQGADASTIMVASFDNDGTSTTPPSIFVGDFDS